MSQSNVTLEVSPAVKRALGIAVRRTLTDVGDADLRDALLEARTVLSPDLGDEPRVLTTTAGDLRGDDVVDLGVLGRATVIYARSVYPFRVVQVGFSLDDDSGFYVEVAPKTTFVVERKA